MKCFRVSLFLALPLLAQFVSGLALPEAALVARQDELASGGAKGGATGAGGAKGGATGAGGAKGGATGAGGAAGGNTGGATGAGSNTTTTANNAGGGTNTTATGNNAGGSTTNTTATGNNAAGGGGNAAGGDLQTSLTLDPSVIAPAFAAGQGQAAGEANSLQSTNNFINFCAGKTITNGAQVTTGSCNPAPMGDIPASTNMPSAKFQVPANGDTIAANTAFTISLAIQGMQTGTFTNAAASYFSAPQQLNSAGQIIGHSHVVVEQLSALDQTTPTDPTKFAFFKGLNAAAQGGVLTADVTDGLPAGVYKVSTINTAANHQPVLVPIAQHGSTEDVSYFTVSAGGAAGGNNGTAGGAGGAVSSSAAAPPASTSTTAAGGKGGAAGGATGAGGAKGGATGAGGAGGAKGGAKGGKRRFLADY